MKNIIVAVFAALALVACSAQETAKPTVAQAPACEVSAQDERDIAAKEGFEFRSLSGEAARNFATSTGADPAFAKDVELVQVFLGVYPGSVAISAYDRNGCKFGGAIIPEEAVFGKIA
jgi:hypothetical protein